MKNKESLYGTTVETASNSGKYPQMLLEVDPEKINQIVKRKLQSEIEGGDQSPAGTMGQLFNLGDLQKVRRLNLSQDQLKEKLKAISIHDSRRELVLSTAERIQSIELLADKYENFSEFIYQEIIPQLHLQMLSKEPISLTPFCLLGPPGIGKTAFLTELAEALNVGGRIFDANIMQSAAVLSGLTRVYSNANVGLIFDAMLFGKTEEDRPIPLNSLFCIDEVEKVADNPQLGTTHDLLLSLLERRTAERFVDSAVPELKLNLSKLMWAFTANSVQTLGGALQSRLSIVEIQRPTQDQAKKIAEGMFIEQVAALQAKGIPAPYLPEQELEKLLQLSPREQKRAIYLAIAQAVRRGNADVVIQMGKQEKSARIGFL